MSMSPHRHRLNSRRHPHHINTLYDTIPLSSTPTSCDLPASYTSPANWCGRTSSEICRARCRTCHQTEHLPRLPWRGIDLFVLSLGLWMALGQHTWQYRVGVTRGSVSKRTVKCCRLFRSRSLFRPRAFQARSLFEKTFLCYLAEGCCLESVAGYIDALDETGSYTMTRCLYGRRRRVVALRSRCDVASRQTRQTR